MNNEPIYISLDEGAELPTNMNDLEDKFNNCFRENNFNIVVNLEKIKIIPTRFIVTLIKATSQARRLGGDVKLINLNPTIRSNLVTFSPRTFLTIETSEKYALQDFGETFDPRGEFDISENVNVLASMTEEKETEGKSDENERSNEANISRLVASAQEKIRVQSKVDNLYEICDFVIDKAKKTGFDLRERGKIKVTVYEACLNVIEHAYFSNHDHWIDVYVGNEEKKFIIIIQDWGESFEFDPSRQYDVEQAVKDRRTGGFGLHIIRRSVDEIYYFSDANEGNRLILVKYITDNT